MPSFHASDDLLMDYAAGSLSEPKAVLVATHLALCPACRATVGSYESIGGALIESISTDRVDTALRDSVLAQLDDIEPEAPPMMTREALAQIDLRVPEPLRGYLGAGLDDLDWKTRGRVGELRLIRDHASHTSRLFRIKAGAPMPQHTHEGTELTLVLAGGFTDHDKHYLRGDVAAADETIDHRPIADAGEDCYCFAVTDAPLRLTGTFSRFLNPFIDM